VLATVGQMVEHATPPTGVEPCYWDKDCPGLGCGAQGVANCRYCGFEPYGPCKKNAPATRCCKALIPSCLACTEGTTVENFCKDNAEYAGSAECAAMSAADGAAGTAPLSGGHQEAEPATSSADEPVPVLESGDVAPPVPPNGEGLQGGAALEGAAEAGAAATAASTGAAGSEPFDESKGGTRDGSDPAGPSDPSDPESDRAAAVRAEEEPDELVPRANVVAALAASQSRTVSKEPKGVLTTEAAQPTAGALSGGTLTLAILAVSAALLLVVVKVVIHKRRFPSAPYDTSVSDQKMEEERGFHDAEDPDCDDEGDDDTERSRHTGSGKGGEQAGEDDESPIKIAPPRTPPQPARPSSEVGTSPIRGSPHRASPGRAAQSEVNSPASRHVSDPRATSSGGRMHMGTSPEPPPELVD